MKKGEKKVDRFDFVKQAFAEGAIIYLPVESSNILFLGVKGPEKMNEARVIFKSNHTEYRYLMAPGRALDWFIEGLQAESKGKFVHESVVKPKLAFVKRPDMTL